MNIITGKKRRPRRVLLYGTHGIGKSTWAADAPAPLFLCTEEGADDIGVDRTPVIRELTEFENWLTTLEKEKHGYKTVVIDSVDWLEQIVATRIREQHGEKVFADYGKGYLFAKKHWTNLLFRIDILRNIRGMAVVLLGHERSAKVEPPDADSYTRHEPDLHASVSSMIQEYVDEVLFANYKIRQIKKEEGFGRERAIAVGGERVVYTTEKPTHLAKRRIEMPDIIELNFGTYVDYINASYASDELPKSGNIAGIVKNGHSKQKEETYGISQ